VGRFDTRMRRPPVRIGLAQARVQATQLLNDSLYTARGAGDYGMREARFGSVPLRLRIDKGVGANTDSIKAGVLPIGRTHRKQGFPPVTEETLFGAVTNTPS
jgi:hypothetical protein